MATTNNSRAYLSNDYCELQLNMFVLCLGRSAQSLSIRQTLFFQFIQASQIIDRIEFESCKLNSGRLIDLHALMKL